MKKASALMAALMLVSLILSGCGTSQSQPDVSSGSSSSSETTSDAVDTDQAAADRVAALIDAIYVQQRTGDTDAQCVAAKEAWDALTDAQKELV